MDYIPPDSSVCGISQARILEWVPFSSLGDLPDPRIGPKSAALQVNSLSLSNQGSPSPCLYIPPIRNVFPFLSACLSPTNLSKHSHSPRVTAYSFLSSLKCDAHNVSPRDFKLCYMAPSYLPFSKVFFFFFSINLISLAQTEQFFFSSSFRFLMICSINLSYSPGRIGYLFLFLLGFVIVLYTDTVIIFLNIFRLLNHKSKCLLK